MTRLTHLRSPADVEVLPLRSSYVTTERRSQAAEIAIAVVPGVLIVYFSFRSGGFFPGTVAVAATAMLVALVLQVTLRGGPVAGASLPYVVVSCALTLFAVWTLVSSAWSDAPARALVEYDRVLLYLAAFVVFGMLGRTASGLRWMIRLLVLGTVVVCTCSLITRLAPDVWAVEPSRSLERLSFPLSYWNALGLLAALGFVLATALTCDDREAPAGRVLAAAGLPILGVTLLLTFSRGSIAVAAAGLVVLVLAGRPRALPGGLLAAVPTVWIAVHAAYGADLLATSAAAGPAVVAQGHHVARVVLACVVAAAALRALALVLDARLARVTLPAPLRRPAVAWGAVLGAVLVAGALAVALSVPARMGDQYDRFVHGSSPDAVADLRDRLTNPDNNGRLIQWRVAIDGFDAQSLHGEGAGTYALQWDRLRPQIYTVEDAHSLYAEVLGELGIVGFVLIAGAIALILGGFALLARGPDRVLGGALLAAGLMWAVHAGIDWDWEMPAVTFWLFAAGGLALGGARSATSRAGATGAMAPALRVVVGAGLLVLLLVPVSIYRSEGPLRDSVQAFARGDCPTAIDRALDSSDALGIRPEPYVVIGYCDVRMRRPELAVRAMQAALREDPSNWELHYGLAVVRAAAGRDPRPQLRQARRLNPGEELTTHALALFDTRDASKWRTRALRAELPTR